MNEREEAQKHLNDLVLISKKYPDLEMMVKMYTGMAQVILDHVDPVVGLDDYSSALIVQSTRLVHDAIMAQQMGEIIANAVSKVNADLAYGDEPGDDELDKAVLPESLRGIFK